MARLITKFKYLKPEDRKNIGGYAEYIATREGVEKIDESKRNAPATNKQKQLIKKILSDFPDSKSSLEYEDYLKDKTIGTASEFITRALEENADEMMHTKTYADYIATRPRAERIGSHGLFTDDGVAVDLQKVSDELNAHTGNVWTAIVSLRREDAERLGYDNGSRWRDMLRSQTQTLSKNLRIPMSNLRWFAAFHNESYHPHVHMIVYSTDPTEGYLSEKGVMALRSSFAKDIFAQDLLCEYKKQTEHRDALKVQSREVLAELIAKIEADFGTTPDILVNNAGVIQRTPMLDMSAEDFRRVVDIDLNAPFIVSKACLPGMIAKGHGKIINICSMMSELGRETIAGYAAAKGGLKMLTKNICSEFGEANIQCNGIGPGYIATPQTAPLRETQPDGSRHPFDQFIIAKTPAARWGTPEDLKGPAVFLASDASNFVNGHILYVDGGILAYIGKQPQ